MRRQHLIKEIAILSPTAIILLLWVWSKTRPGGWEITVFQGLTQVVSLIAFQLFSIVLVISARSRSIERIYGGLDRSYHTHGKLARVAFVLMLLHPLLLVPHYWMNGTEIYKLFWFSDFWPRNVGIASWYGFILLVMLTLYRKLEYQKWLTSHKLMGIPFVLGGIHAINANSDIKAFEPLRDWVVFWLILGTWFWLYKVFLYKEAAKKYTYRVESNVDRGGIWDLELSPVRSRMNYEPGEFAFIAPKGHRELPEEAHPFTIASDPSKWRLRFGIRASGDFTKRLGALQAGDEVEVFGPYGEFTSYNFDHIKRQIWIGGGIGITPFLSMLAHEAKNEDPKEITLIYSTKGPGDAVFDSEIREHLAGSEDKVVYFQHQSDAEGFLTAERIMKDFQFDPAQTLILLCGPPVMMHNLRKQFQAIGVPAAHVEFEDFNFV